MLEIFLIGVLVVALVIIVVVAWQLWARGGINKEEAQDVVADDAAAVKRFFAAIVARARALRKKSQ